MSRDFDGSTAYLRASSVPLTTFPLSVSAWVNPDTTKEQVITGLASSLDNVNGFFMYLGANGKPAWWTIDPTDWDSGAVGATTYSTGAWQHVGAVQSSATSKVLYFNGTQDATNTTSKTPTGIDRMSIGRRDMPSATEYFDGKIAHVAWWNAALTAAEMSMLGSGNLSPLAVRPQSLVIYSPYLGRDTADIDIIGARTWTNTNSTASASEPPVLWLPSQRKILVPPASATPIVWPQYQHRQSTLITM